MKADGLRWPSVQAVIAVVGLLRAVGLAVAYALFFRSPDSEPSHDARRACAALQDFFDDLAEADNTSALRDDLRRAERAANLTGDTQLTRALADARRAQAGFAKTRNDADASALLRATFDARAECERMGIQLRV
jgi:hypothetical protein